MNRRNILSKNYLVKSFCLFLWAYICCEPMAAAPSIPWLTRPLRDDNKWCRWWFCCCSWWRWRFQL